MAETDTRFTPDIIQNLQENLKISSVVGAIQYDYSVEGHTPGVLDGPLLRALLKFNAFINTDENTAIDRISVDIGEDGASQIGEANKALRSKPDETHRIMLEDLMLKLGYVARDGSAPISRKDLGAATLKFYEDLREPTGADPFAMQHEDFLAALKKNLTDKRDGVEKIGRNTSNAYLQLKGKVDAGHHVSNARVIGSGAGVGARLARGAVPQIPATDYFPQHILENFKAFVPFVENIDKGDKYHKDEFSYMTALEKAALPMMAEALKHSKDTLKQDIQDAARAHLDHVQSLNESLGLEGQEWTDQTYNKLKAFMDQQFSDESSRAHNVMPVMNGRLAEDYKTAVRTDITMLRASGSDNGKENAQRLETFIVAITALDSAESQHHQQSL